MANANRLRRGDDGKLYHGGYQTGQGFATIFQTTADVKDNPCNTNIDPRVFCNNCQKVSDRGAYNEKWIKTWRCYGHEDPNAPPLEMTTRNDQRDFTGCLNQQTFMADRDDFEVKAARTLSAAFAVDIANFKQLNDAVGHGEGDRFLKRYGSEINDACRKLPAARVYHSGGDEFQILVHYKQEGREFEDRVVQVTKELANINFESRGVKTFLRIGVVCKKGVTFNQADRVENRVRSSILSRRGLEDREAAYDVPEEERYIIEF